MEDVKGNIFLCHKEEINNSVSVNFNWQMAEFNYMNNNGQQNGHQSNLANKCASKCRKAPRKKGQNGNNPAIRSPTICNRKSGKRKKSSEKERNRNLQIKARLQQLTEMMPYVAGAELPRIRILRLANEYINHLKRMLEGETIICPKTGQKRPLQKEDFAENVNREMQIKNTYSDRIEEEMDYDQKISGRGECSSSYSKIFHNELANYENGQNLEIKSEKFV